MTDDLNDYISVSKAMKNTGQSRQKPAQLCQDGELECRKNARGHWQIQESSLYDYWMQYLRFDADDNISWSD